VDGKGMEGGRGEEGGVRKENGRKRRSTERREGEVGQRAGISTVLHSTLDLSITKHKSQSNNTQSESLLQEVERIQNGLKRKYIALQSDCTIAQSTEDE
jgi:hypothetical protein